MFFYCCTLEIHTLSYNFCASRVGHGLGSKQDSDCHKAAIRAEPGCGVFWGSPEKRLTSVSLWLLAGFVSSNVGEPRVLCFLPGTALISLRPPSGHSHVTISQNVSLLLQSQQGNLFLFRKCSIPLLRAFN